MFRRAIKIAVSKCASRFIYVDEDNAEAILSFISEDSLFIVIASEFLERKKSQKLTKRDKQIIEKVATYEYRFE